MKKKYSLFTLIIIIVFSNCSVEKRHYMHGYMFEWNKKNKAENTEVHTANVDANLTASTDKEIIPITADHLPLINNNDDNLSITDSTDIIITARKTIKAKVKAINKRTIFYVYWDGKDTIRRLINKGAVQEIKFSNGANLSMFELTTLIVQTNNRKELIVKAKEIDDKDAQEKELIKNKCYDKITIGNKTFNAIVSEINDRYIVYTVYIDDGKVCEGLNIKQEIKAITFCGGAKAFRADFANVNTLITDRKVMRDSLFWLKYNCDILKCTNKIITGTITEIGPEVIKYNDYNDPRKEEITIKSKSVKTINLNNGALLSKKEIRELNNKYVSTIEVQNYGRSKTHKEFIISELTRKSCANGAAFLVPLIGFAFDIKAVVYGIKAKLFIKKNPEFKSYSTSANLGLALGVVGILINIFCITFLFVAILGSIGAGIFAW